MGSTEDQAVAWRALCFELARALKCLPSVSVGGNRHVLAAAEEAQAAREAAAQTAPDARLHAWMNVAMQSGNWLPNRSGMPVPSASAVQSAAQEAAAVSKVCSADAQAVAMAARRVSNWMAAGCSGEPPRPQLALLHTLCAEMAAGALGARAQRVTQGAQ